MTFRSKEAAQMLLAMNPEAYMVMKILKINKDTVEIEPVVMIDDKEITYGEKAVLYAGDSIQSHGAQITIRIETA